jgi:hypothetical protein
MNGCATFIASEWNERAAQLTKPAGITYQPGVLPRRLNETS